MTSTAGEHDNPNQDTSLMICSNAMLGILGKGNKFSKTGCKAVIANNVPLHSLRGRILNTMFGPDYNIFLSLFWFFEEIQKLAEPRATRLVGEFTNTNGVQEDNETLIFQLG